MQFSTNILLYLGNDARQAQLLQNILTENGTMPFKIFANSGLQRFLFFYQTTGVNPTKQSQIFFLVSTRHRSEQLTATVANGDNNCDNSIECGFSRFIEKNLNDAECRAVSLRQLNFVSLFNSVLQLLIAHCFIWFLCSYFWHNCNKFECQSREWRATRTVFIARQHTDARY